MLEVIAATINGLVACSYIVLFFYGIFTFNLHLLFNMFLASGFFMGIGMANDSGNMKIVGTFFQVAGLLSLIWWLIVPFKAKNYAEKHNTKKSKYPYFFRHTS